jgi:hypothetical protein
MDVLKISISVLVGCRRFDIFYIHVKVRPVDNFQFRLKIMLKK